jgi:Flp pilus assembly protein TadD
VVKKVTFSHARLDARPDSPHDLQRLKNKAAFIFLIIAAAFAVYWPSLQNGFVWDDTALILRDPFIRSWRLIPDGFHHYLFTDATAANFYRPLQRLTYTGDYALYAFAPWGYHLTNLLIHALAAVALFFFMGELIVQFAVERKVNAPLIALLTSLLWVVHPLHTSAVIYVSGRADLLAALFGFAGLYLALRGRPPLAAVCFLAALLSKESGIVAIATWFLILAWRRKEIRRWLVIAPLIFGLYFGLRLSAELIPPPTREPVRMTTRPILMARAVGEYAGLFIVPVTLHMERNLTGVGREGQTGLLKRARMRDYQTLLGVLLALAFCFWLRWTKRNSTAAFLCLLGFLISYLPVSNLFTLNATAAEHWLYVPGAYLIAATLLSLALTRISTPLLALIYATWLLFFGARTLVRNADWKDQRSFVESTISDGGDSARMLINLGMLESSSGHPKAGLVLFQEALQRSPDQPLARLNLASAYLRLHEFSKARVLLQKALESPETRTGALLDLTALEYLENNKLRIDLLKKATEISPTDWPVRKRYISGLAETGNLPAAIEELRGLLERQPYRAESWHLLGDLLVRVGRRDIAKTAFSQAADYDVHDDTAREKARSL